MKKLKDKIHSWISQLLFKFVKEKGYIWMLNNLPYRMMWVNAYEKNDMGTEFWIPRYGWPKTWMDKAEKRAEELNNNIKWE